METARLPLWCFFKSLFWSCEKKCTRSDWPSQVGHKMAQMIMFGHCTHRLGINGRLNLHQYSIKLYDMSDSWRGIWVVCRITKAYRYQAEWAKNYVLISLQGELREWRSECHKQLSDILVTNTAIIRKLYSGVNSTWLIDLYGADWSFVVELGQLRRRILNRSELRDARRRPHARDSQRLPFSVTYRVLIRCVACNLSVYSDLHDATLRRMHRWGRHKPRFMYSLHQLQVTCSDPSNMLACYWRDWQERPQPVTVVTSGSRESGADDKRFAEAQRPGRRR